MKLSVENVGDRELLLSIKGNDNDAFERIYEKYALRLYYFSIRILKSKEEAEEVVQDTFLKVWEKRGEIDENLNFNTYLITIAKHKIFNLFRRKVIEQKYAVCVAEESEDQLLVEQDSWENELKDVLRKTIDKLPPQQREIMLLKIEGYSNEEIAESLSISKKTVENHLNRAYKQLRLQLGEWHELLPLLIIVTFIF